MLKFLVLSLALSVCNCQYILNNGLSGLGYGGGYGLGLGGQYLLAGQGLSPQTVLVLQSVPQQQLALAPIARPTYAIRAPTPLISAPAPVIVQSAPAPAPVIIRQEPRPLVVEENYGPAEPYTFGYQTTDEEGNSASRQESSDGNGGVRGSYSYTDVQGLQRIVEYIADAAGYRATVKTNEPGTANANPADVQMIVSEPPPAVVAKYANPPRRVN